VEKYNNLTLIKTFNGKYRPGNGYRKMGLFKCDCGNESIKDYHAVKCGNNKSCMECGRVRTTNAMIKHNLVDHKLYRKWQDMLNRCRNKNVDRFKHYGGRGIKVCEEWVNDFKTYYEWCIFNGWQDGLQVDRIDVNGNYDPSNCRIVKPVEQGFNKQNTFYINYNGERHSLAKLCYEQNLKYRTIYNGMKKGKDFSYYVEKLGIKF